jgi:hypothetical protein
MGTMEGERNHAPQIARPGNDHNILRSGYFHSTFAVYAIATHCYIHSEFIINFN